MIEGHVIEGPDARADVMLGRNHPRWQWLVPPLVTLAVCLVDIGHRVLSQDELATLSATDRSLPDLVRLTAHRDAVLGPYYALLSLWTDLFGSSATSLRVPSALAMTGAAAVIALLAHRLCGGRAGLWAGLVFALLPPVSQFGQQARPYAFTLLLAATSTLLLVRALDGPSRRSWAGYGLALVALGLCQITALSVLGAHAVYLWLRQRDAWRAWLVSAGVALIVLLPVAAIGSRQSQQIAWIPDPSLDVVLHLPERLLLSGWLATALLVLLLPAVARRTAAGWFGLALVVVPVVALTVESLAIPVLIPRYLIFTVLGLVLLAGASLARVPWYAALVALLGVGLLGLTAHQAVRSETMRGQPDYRLLAGILAAQNRPGDAIVMPTEAGIRFRNGIQAYLRPDQRPADVLAEESPARAAALDWQECDAVARCLGHPPRLWVGCLGRCRDPLSSLPAPVAAAVRAAGYRDPTVQTVHGGGLALYLTPPTP